jgi:hypothetical protein
MCSPALFVVGASGVSLTAVVCAGSVNGSAMVRTEKDGSRVALIGIYLEECFKRESIRSSSGRVKKEKFTEDALISTVTLSPLSACLLLYCFSIPTFQRTSGNIKLYCVTATSFYLSLSESILSPANIILLSQLRLALRWRILLRRVPEDSSKDLPARTLGHLIDDNDTPANAIHQLLNGRSKDSQKPTYPRNFFAGAT